MRERPGSRDTQRIKRGSGNGDSIGGLRFAQSERLRYPGGDCVSTLRGVVKPLRAHRSDLTQATLLLVYHGQCREQVAPASPGILSCGQSRSEVITGVTG